MLYLVNVSVKSGEPLTRCHQVDVNKANVAAGQAHTDTTNQAASVNASDVNVTLILSASHKPVFS